MQLILKRNSWHYKFNRLAQEILIFTGNAAAHKNLCGYFWVTVWNLLVGAISLGILWGLLTVWGALSLGVFGEPNVIWNNLEPYGVIYWSWIFGIVSIAVWCFFVACVVGLIFLLIRCFDCLVQLQNNYQLTRNQKTKTKETNLLFAYIKAKKEKYCPIIKWE